MVALPSGTVTFLFTDMEGSTSLWEANPDQMRADLAVHNETLDAVMAEYSGAVFKLMGDAFCVAFASAERAVAAAIQAQKRLKQACPRIKVRMGLHTGAIEPTGGDYFGQPVNRASRIMSIASGGQVLASETTRSLLPAGIPLRDLGQQMLKDLMEPTRIWQVGEGDFKPLRGLAAVQNNLPLQTTSFVGRETEMADLQALLAKSRLLTLTGTGGTGKSRLALQLAAENVDQFPDGVWFVELAALPDREDVLREVLATVGAPEVGGTQLERLLAHLGRKRSCVILDNCEHVLSIASDLAERLVRSCQALTVVATSREPLGMAGETIYRVPSLPAPSLDRPLTLCDLERFGACALFVDRLATAAPEYGLQDSDAMTIAKICTRLDGIPLALELAAARGRAMRLDQIERRLDDRFRLLTGGSRNALSRQQTLQALIDWSVQLLNETERNLFAAVSVFAGGWRLEAAEAVCGCNLLGIESWQVLDLITGLVDKSLVIFEHSSGRFKLLESLRQYASELMARSDWGLELRDRHADYFLQLADPKVQHGMVLPVSCQEIFVAEYENIRAALDWSRGDEHRAAEAARVATSLWPGFLMLERSAEFARQLEPLIEIASSVVTPRERDRFRINLAVACARTDDSRALSMLEDARATLDGLPTIERTQAATALGYALFRAERPQESIEVLSPLTQIEAGIDNQYFAYVFTILGLSRACLGDLDQAEIDTERACKELILREDWRGWAAAKVNLAIIAILGGDMVRAVRHAMEQTAMLTKRQSSPKLRWTMLSVYGAAAMEAGAKKLAMVLFGGGRLSFRDDLDPADPLDCLFVDHVIKLIDAAFEPHEAQRLIEIGRRHSWEPWFQAIMNLDPDTQFVNGRFVVPFPELIGFSCDD